MYVNYTVLSKELLDFWNKNEVTVKVRQKFLRATGCNIRSAKTDCELSFSADCAYVWGKDTRCITMKWDEYDKLIGSFNLILTCHFTHWYTTSETINHNVNEDRLQKQETHVVRGDDGEGNRVQSRKRKASVTVGYLSNKAVKG